MYSIPTKLNNLIQPCIDKSEIEDLDKVFKKIKIDFNIPDLSKQ